MKKYIYQFLFALGLISLPLHATISCVGTPQEFIQPSIAAAYNIEFNVAEINPHERGTEYTLCFRNETSNPKYSFHIPLMEVINPEEDVTLENTRRYPLNLFPSGESIYWPLDHWHFTALINREGERYSDLDAFVLDGQVIKKEMRYLEVVLKDAV